MDRLTFQVSQFVQRNPHARGDGPHGCKVLRVIDMESPRAWGWTGQVREAHAGDDGIPTRVGMDRWAPARAPSAHRNPHARGDGRGIADTATAPIQESPRAWGWTGPARGLVPAPEGIPTRVGMDRSCRSTRARRPWNPHARGDGPYRDGDDQWLRLESPRAWGWTAQAAAVNRIHSGIPTRVGMDRPSPPVASCSMWNPHARGDGPTWLSTASSGSRESPRAWGWTGCRLQRHSPPGGIPTRVGMDRRGHRTLTARLRNPHARGDGPGIPRISTGAAAESPRAWGWTGVL